MMIKVFLTLTIFLQVKGGLDIVKPIMKEYRDAQAGLTNGVAMTARKSKKMKSHMSLVKGLTCIWFLATFICVPLAKTFMHSLIDDVVDVYYKDVRDQASSFDQPQTVVSKDAADD